MDAPAEYIDALIDLHRGLEYKGPGDADFSRRLLNRLPTLPPNPRIADLGCGSGASALVLAQYYASPVLAVDIAAVFIHELKVRAKQAGLEDLIVPIHGDMAELDESVSSLDLLWSEGAAYNLGFEQALKLWRPRLSQNGIAVISELSWLTNDAPEPAIAYWQNAYPAIGTESENIARAKRSGFRLLASARLPSQAWWTHYYDPLRERMQQMEITPSLQVVIRETEEEIKLFEQFSDAYGYIFYVLQAM